MTNILIATPCHRGEVHVEYSRAIAQLCTLLGTKGIEYEWFTLLEESLVTRARNATVAYFLSKNFTHLLFVDSDIVFDPEDVLRMLEKDYDVMSGAYPKKTLDINKIVSTTIDHIKWEAVKEVFEKGMTPTEVCDTVKKSISPLNIYLKSLTYVVGCATDTKVEEGWMRADEVGCGFLMIKREVICRLRDKNPSLKYTNDCVQYNQLHENMKDNFYLLFDTRLVNGRYLSEDFAFCHLVRETGYDIWVNTACGLNHIGSHVYKGNLYLALSS